MSSSRAVCGTQHLSSPARACEAITSINDTNSRAGVCGVPFVLPVWTGAQARGEKCPTSPFWRYTTPTLLGCCCIAALDITCAQMGEPIQMHDEQREEGIANRNHLAHSRRRVNSCREEMPSVRALSCRLQNDVPEPRPQHATPRLNGSSNPCSTPALLLSQRDDPVPAGAMQGIILAHEGNRRNPSVSVTQKSVSYQCHIHVISMSYPCHIHVLSKPSMQHRFWCRSVADCQPLT